MLETLKNAWKIPELRKKIIFTLFILLIYRAGNVIPVPYIDTATLTNYFDSVLSSTILGLYNAMSGSAFSRATVFALSIQPYINASIIIQLLTIAIPALERMAKEEGEEGQKKIARITRYTTVGLGLLMGWAYYQMLVNYSNQGFSIVTQQGFAPAMVIILTFTAGSAFVMWLGEQITEFGIGNGISMILFANIISGIPGMIGTLFSMVWWQILIVLVGMAALVLFIIFINDAERRIPIQYDPVEISNNLKKNGGFIPGFRPGRPTADFIQKVINKIVVFGAVYLGIVALLPIVAGNLMNGVRNLAIGGTSVIIVVGVALETVKALEAQLLMRHYKGFLD